MRFYYHGEKHKVYTLTLEGDEYVVRWGWDTGGYRYYNKSIVEEYFKSKSWIPVGIEPYYKQLIK